MSKPARRTCAKYPLIFLAPPSTTGLIPSLHEIGHQLRLPLFQDSDLRLQPLQLAVDASQLGLGLLGLQVVVAMLLLALPQNLWVETV
jgi:hypothetical protein